MLFGKLSPRTHPRLPLLVLPPFADVVWHMSTRPCLPLLFSPFFCLSPFRTFHTPSLSLSLQLLVLIQILFVSPSAPSPNFPSSLHPSFLPPTSSLSLSTRAQMFKLFVSPLFFPFSPFPSTHQPSVSFLCPDVFWTEMISPAVRMKLKSVPRQQKNLLFWAGGVSCHSHVLAASIKKATHTVTQAVWARVCVTRGRAGSAKECASVWAYMFICPSCRIMLRIIWYQFQGFYSLQSGRGRSHWWTNNESPFNLQIPLRSQSFLTSSSSIFIPPTHNFTVLFHSHCSHRVVPATVVSFLGKKALETLCILPSHHPAADGRS